MNQKDHVFLIEVSSSTVTPLDLIKFISQFASPVTVSQWVVIVRDIRQAVFYLYSKWETDNVTSEERIRSLKWICESEIKEQDISVSVSLVKSVGATQSHGNWRGLSGEAEGRMMIVTISNNHDLVNIWTE